MLIGYQVRYDVGDGRMLSDEGGVDALDFAEAAEEIAQLYPNGFEEINMWIESR